MDQVNNFQRVSFSHANHRDCFGGDGLQERNKMTKEQEIKAAAERVRRIDASTLRYESQDWYSFMRELYPDVADDSGEYEEAESEDRLLLCQAYLATRDERDEREIDEDVWKELCPDSWRIERAAIGFFFNDDVVRMFGKDEASNIAIDIPLPRVRKVYQLKQLLELFGN